MAGIYQQRYAALFVCVFLFIQLASHIICSCSYSHIPFPRNTVSQCANIMASLIKHSSVLSTLTVLLIYATLRKAQMPHRSTFPHSSSKIFFNEFSVRMSYGRDTHYASLIQNTNISSVTLHYFISVRVYKCDCKYLHIIIETPMSRFLQYIYNILHKNQSIYLNVHMWVSGMQLTHNLLRTPKFNFLISLRPRHRLLFLETIGGLLLKRSRQEGQDVVHFFLCTSAMCTLAKTN